MKRITSGDIRSFLQAAPPVPAPAKGDAGNLPRISVVTPSFNQAGFLERTILSVLNQGYPNLEYIVVDGGSGDGSVDILRKYEHHLSAWVSEEDRGQSDAINKGFRIATGDLVAWQNSDDIYLPGAFWKVVKAYRESPQYDVYFGNMCTIDEEDEILHEHRYTPFSVECLLYDGWNITNQSAFFRKEIVRRYPLQAGLRYAMDGDYFVRIGLGGARFRFIRDSLGAFRIHGKAKSGTIDRTVGVEEWVKIRESRGILMRTDIPWGRQYLGRKALCKARKLFHYLRQGDFDYIGGKIVRMVRGVSGSS
ncbi:MAG: glycosyltransferase [Deltaproteobacteria bacterium]|nr:glycosyltransferase [Deltaproteobacteria bacterium]MBP2685104.1 glycosyltransferase [Deltaproteobacteria bacterium]